MPEWPSCASCARNSAPFSTPGATVGACSEWPEPLAARGMEHVMTTPNTSAPQAPPPAPGSAPASGAAPPAPATPAPAPSSDGTLDQRMTKVEGQLSEILSLARGQASARPGSAALDRSQVEEITRAELARGQQDAAAADEAAKAEGRLAGIEKSVAKLAETRPRQPARRITKLFWPGHDRD